MRPSWVMLGLGVATAFSGWSAYGPGSKGPSQAEIEEEAKKFECRGQRPGRDGSQAGVIRIFIESMP